MARRLLYHQGIEAALANRDLTGRIDNPSRVPLNACGRNCGKATIADQDIGCADKMTGDNAAFDDGKID